MNTYVLIAKPAAKLPRKLRVGRRFTDAELDDVFELNGAGLTSYCRGEDRLEIQSCIFRIEFTPEPAIPDNAIGPSL